MACNKLFYTPTRCRCSSQRVSVRLRSCCNSNGYFRIRWMGFIRYDSRVLLCCCLGLRAAKNSCRSWFPSSGRHRVYNKHHSIAWLEYCPLFRCKYDGKYDVKVLCTSSSRRKSIEDFLPSTEKNINTLANFVHSFLFTQCFALHEVLLWQ